MPDDPSIAHPAFSAEDLFDYFQLRLPEWRQIEIEAHLATCDTCAAEAGRLHRLVVMLEGWNVDTHARAIKLYELEQALTEAQLDLPLSALRERLGQLAGTVEAAVLIVIDATGKASQMLTEHLEALLGPTAPAAFSPVLVARVRGAEEEGKVREATLEGDAPVRVGISGREEVSVRVEEAPADKERLEVLVMRLGKEDVQAVEARDREQPPEAPYRSVRYTTPPGLYIAGKKKETRV